jgi:hypothetical protein
MPCRRIAAAAIGAVTLTMMAAPLSAHGIWFAQRAKQLALVYGVGADDLDAIKRLPHSGQEVKAHMEKGDSFVFTWSSTGPVKAEMHGEELNAADDAFTDYWKEPESAGGQGDFTAPFAGIHGWYFRNKGDTPVTVTVKTVGFYKDLFQPQSE